MSKDQELKQLGNKAFKDKKYDEAIKFFSQAIQLNPNDHTYYSNRSNAYVNSGNYQQALLDAESCIKVKPDWARGYQRKGTALFYQQKYDDAIQCYKKGLEIDPNNQALKKDMESAQQKKQGPGAGNFDMKQMEMFMKLLSHPETKEYMQDPSFMMIVQQAMQNPQMLPILMQQDPRVKKVMEVLMGQMGSGNFNPGSFAGSPGSFPKFTPPKKQKSQMPKQQQAKSAPSQPKQQKIQQQNPAQDLKNKGNQAFKNKKFEEALNLYEEAIKLKPEQVLYYNNKAAAYIQLNELDKALEQISKCQKLFDDGTVKDFVKKAKVYARKASILTKQNKLDEAILAYQKSLVEDHVYKIKEELNKVKKIKKQKQAKEYINPEIAEQNCQNGNTLYKEAKYPQALHEYQEAIRRNPQVAKYYSNLGTVYIKLMEFPKARDNFDKALLLDPTYVKAYAKKGDCHFFLKQYHKALETYEAGLKRDPANQNCKNGVTKTQQAIYMNNSNEDQQARAKRAMTDPEIQTILQTPQVRNALAELERDPKAAANILKNPDLAAKIQKLIEAGVLKVG